MAETKIRITFSRRGNARFVSQLDAMNHLLRAVRRSGLPYVVTQGCHPRPKTSFGPPVALGFSSLCEVMDLSLAHPVTAEEVEKALKTQLPQGFGLESVEECRPGLPPLTAEAETEFRLEFAPGAEQTCEQARTFFLDPDTCIRAGKPGQERNVILSGAVREARLQQGPPLALDVIFAPPGKGIPSGAKIIQAFLAGLGDRQQHVVLIERVRISAERPAKQETPANVTPPMALRGCTTHPGEIPDNSDTTREVKSEFPKNSGDGGSV